MSLLVLGSTALVMSLVQAYGYMDTRKMILAAGEAAARHQTLSIARRMEQEFRAVAKVPQALADFLRFHPPGNTEILKSLLHAAAYKNPEIFGCGLFFEPHNLINGKPAFAPYYFRQGDRIEYAQLAKPSYDYFTREFYAIPMTLGQAHWSDPYFDRSGSNALMVTYSVPLFHPDNSRSQGDLMGVATSDISLKWLTSLLGEAYPGKTGFAFILNRAGVFVSHPNQERIVEDSIFSMAEKLGRPELRTIGRTMIREPQGFMPIGRDLAGEEAFLAWATIPSTGWTLGAAVLKSELFAQLDALRREALIMASAGGGLLLLASVLVARSLARPLITMAGATRQIARGDFDVDLSRIHNRDEVGQLALSIGDMAKGLKQKEFIRDTFGRYLTKEVVASLLESKDGLKLGGEAREITLMMSDLRGFTSLTAHMSPEDVILFLNRYLGRMVDVLVSRRGVIDEIIGDGILAFFGAPEPMADHAAQAVACALEMQEAMEEINAENEKLGLANMEMGIAVHTATVVVGNIGSEQRSKYGAVGAGVNFTGRMESYSVGGQVLISEGTRRKVADYVKIKQTLTPRMKGVPGKVSLFDVRGMKAPFNITLPDRDGDLNHLAAPIRVNISRLNDKIVDARGAEARIIAVSKTSALMVFDRPVTQWENLKGRLLGVDPKGMEFYGKVIEISSGDSKWKALVRLTSLSPGAQDIFF